MIIRIGHASERIYIGKRLDRGYRPDPAAAQATRTLASAVGGRAYAEGDVQGALGGARRFLGHGPLHGVGEGLHVVALARWLVLASLLPLGFLLWRRNIA